MADTTDTVDDDDDDDDDLRLQQCWRICGSKANVATVLNAARCMQHIS